MNISLVDIVVVCECR